MILAWTVKRTQQPLYLGKGWWWTDVAGVVVVTPADAIFPVPVTLHHIKTVAVELNSILRLTLTRGR